MSSSLANAIKRKTHKERSQPNARRKFGLLEKHKDYVARAKDFHRKENTIKALRQKAEERNPDEFYFAMQSSKTKAGVHVARHVKDNRYTQAELRLMKTQDVKYLSLKGRTEAEKVKKLRGALHFIGLPAQSRHTVFVDSDKEARTFDPAEYFDTPAELVGRSFNRPRTEQLHEASTLPLPTTSGRADSSRLQSYRELTQRSERQTKLAGLAAEMSYRKELMGKGTKRKLSRKELTGEQLADGAPPVHKWKKERKK